MDQTGFPSKFLQTFGLQAVKRISKWGGGLLKLGVTFAFQQVHQTIHLYVFHNSRFLHSKFKINIIRERNRFNTGWSCHCQWSSKLTIKGLIANWRCLLSNWYNIWISISNMFEYFHMRYSLLCSMGNLLNIFTRDISFSGVWTICWIFSQEIFPLFTFLWFGATERGCQMNSQRAPVKKGWKII